MTLDPATVIAGLLSPALVFLVVAFAWRSVSSSRDDVRQDLLLLPWALVIAFLWHPALVRGLTSTRTSDPFLTLPAGDRAGLVSIVVVAGLTLFALSVAKTRALRRTYHRRATFAPAASDLLLTTLLALLALALAPPLLHAGFRRLFPDLPARRVIESLPSVDHLHTLAFPAANGSLAAHAATLLLWTLLLACLLGWLLDVRRRRRSLGALQAGTMTGTLAMLWWLAALLVG